MSHGKIIVIGAIALVVFFISFGIWDRAQPGAHDTLAQCIADSGATFYGAYWCPHCQEQKSLFGRSEKLLPYQECSTPDRQGQLPECDAVGITGYPTWILGNGKILNGTQDLETLAKETSCVSSL